ncbi:MAG: DUF3341 domain-containing protein [Acetobacteraceae bacterium]|nr:DUF3341 domain-containing protein [Acetobacteraceae bacterium]
MIVARFATKDDLVRAVKRLRQRGLRIETRTPIALPEDEEGEGSWIPLLIFLAGIIGAGLGFGMQSLATASSYPLVIGGRPNFFWTSYTVFAFECGVLAAVATGFVSFFVANRLPRLWEPADECDMLRDATRDGWFLIARGEGAGEAVRDQGPTRVVEMPG